LDGRVHINVDASGESGSRCDHGPARDLESQRLVGRNRLIAPWGKLSAQAFCKLYAEAIDVVERLAARM
jgi:hypothetical protein